MHFFGKESGWLFIRVLFCNLEKLEPPVALHSMLAVVSLIPSHFGDRPQEKGFWLASTRSHG